MYGSTFSFGADFFNQLYNVKPTELAQSIPYVSLSLVGKNGEILEDFNTKFFHKNIWYEDLQREDLRYAERPPLSLRDVEIKTSLASGYLYFVDVKIDLVISRPSFISESTLMSFLLPESNFLLIYGWESPDPFLNEKEGLLMSLQDYSLSTDETGQVYLTLNFKAFNERFNNTYVGDEAIKDESIGDELEGLNSLRNKIRTYERFINDIKNKKASSQLEIEVIKAQVESFRSVEKKTRKVISQRFRKAKKNLATLKRKHKFGTQEFPVVRFHDIIAAMCGPTIQALEDSFVRTEEFRITYGEFNKDAGEFAGQSIADFPINWYEFDRKLRQKRSNGQFVITVEALLNLLISDFLENEEYWRQFLSNSQKKMFRHPDIKMDFSNVFNDNKKYFQLFIRDVKKGIPATADMLNPNKQTLLRDVRSANVPILQLGHANSFIKTTNMTQISDQYMKAALISRMITNRLTARSTTTPDKELPSESVTPLVLPLAGSGEMLGHVRWKPFRSFYFDFGIFIVDGVYQITSVTHKISPGVFNTSVEYLYS